MKGKGERSWRWKRAGEVQGAAREWQEGSGLRRGVSELGAPLGEQPQSCSSVPQREPLCSEQPTEGRTGHHLGKGLPPHPPKAGPHYTTLVTHPRHQMQPCDGEGPSLSLVPLLSSQLMCSPGAVPFICTRRSLEMGNHCPGDSPNQKLGAADKEIKDKGRAPTLKKFIIYWNVVFGDRGSQVPCVPN